MCIGRKFSPLRFLYGRWWIWITLNVRFMCLFRKISLRELTCSLGQFSAELTRLKLENSLTFETNLHIGKTCLENKDIHHDLTYYFCFLSFINRMWKGFWKSFGAQQFTWAYSAKNVIFWKKNCWGWLTSDFFYMHVHLTHFHTMTPFDAPGKEAFWKQCGKKRNCW